MNYPILMADIVDSTSKDSVTLMEHFRNDVNTINKRWERDIISPLTITLGDEFQGIINSVANAIKIIIEFEELILFNDFEFKLRYVLNYGDVETVINNKRAYEMLGEGLTNARRKLNSLKKSENRFLIILEEKDERMEKMLNDAFRLFQFYIDSWKAKDKKIASDFLIHSDYKIVANNFDLNKSTAWRREKSLNIDEYKTIKELILNLSYLYDD